jgi:hypothetical protein
MVDLDALVGSWVVCEMNYVKDPAQNSFSRSIFYLTGALAGDDEKDWFVPFYSTRDKADLSRVEVCKRAKLSPDEYGVIQVRSLKLLADVFRDFIQLGRFDLALDDGKPTSIEALLDECVKRGA